MTTPSNEQLRTALRQVRHRAEARHQAYDECEDGFAERKAAAQKAWVEARDRLTHALAQKKAVIEADLAQARASIAARHEDERQRHSQEFAAAEQKNQVAYDSAQATAEAQYKESRWTIITLHEADKKVARDQFLEAQRSLKVNRKQLREAFQSANALVKSWKCSANLQISLNRRPTLAPVEPWKALEMRAELVKNCTAQLGMLALPRLVQGQLVQLGVLLAWLVLSLPALILDPWYLWLLASTATLVPAGFVLYFWMFRRARQQVATVWQALAQAVYDSQPLRRLCLEQARFMHKEQRRQSHQLHRKSLRKTTGEYRKHVKRMEARRQHQLNLAHQKHNALLERNDQRRDRETKAAEDKHRAAMEQLQAAFDREMHAGQEKQRKLLEDNDRRHAREWQQLARDWTQAVQDFVGVRRGVEDECTRTFPDWQQIAEAWETPTELPRGIPFGAMDVGPADIPFSEPEDARLPRLDLSESTQVPALLPFPERCSLLFKATDEGRELAVHGLQALLLRFWTSLPPGKLRCTILDPVGRGENFGAFMNLADHDESLINSRIWTELSHIEHRLADLTTHMETVLQKFLRNKYQTLAEYNAQAGEVAEPFRLLVAAHFPVNFSTEAARRLISLASSGARCGIYTLVMVDGKQPMPHGVELADLEAVCITLVWRDGKFIWRDPDFNPYLLRLAQPPDDATCTRILGIVGEKAKLANRVEVPFSSIAPAPDDMWTTDSRAGIAIPLGRTGATARQLLTLGKGTSQHVLIAGKTGSGKSTLLHVLITQLATRYSPDEIELYLIDFKKGVEFKTYAIHQLPHARVVAVESEREFGLSVLQRLDVELGRRGELFRAAGVNDLPSYRNANGTTTNLARILLVVDEFQEFFVEDDKIAQEAALLLDRLVRQGRAFGIHVVLGSQTLGGAYSLARATIDQMAVRIALQCSEADAHLILSKENSEARLLSRPGEAIYNSANGLLEGNNLFQIVWLNDDHRDDYLARARELARIRKWQPAEPTIVFEGSMPSDLSKNKWLLDWSEAQANGTETAPQRGPLAWRGFLGDAVAIKEPTEAQFRRQSGANLLIIGQNSEAAFGMLIASLVSLVAQTSSSPSPTAGEGWVAGPAFSLVIGSPLQEESDAFVQQLPDIVPVNLVAQRDLPALLASLCEEIGRRQKDSVEGRPLFVFLYGLQRLRDLRKGDDDFSFGRRGEDKAANPAKNFQTLLREGPPLGIFTLIWCDTLTNLHRSVDRQGLREFEMRVLFQMNASDSSNLLDNPIASKLGPHRALFYTEDQGKTEKFRPYSVPSVEWLRRLFHPALEPM